MDKLTRRFGIAVGWLVLMVAGLGCGDDFGSCPPTQYYDIESNTYPLWGESNTGLAGEMREGEFEVDREAGTATLRYTTVDGIEVVERYDIE